ncbi:MAG: Uma2 family endonuclease [Nocardioidaceae bacterium]
MTGDIDVGRRFTVDELESLPDDGRRYELSDGWLIVSPMARRLHQVGCQNLARVLDSACPDELYVFTLPINVDDPDRTHFARTSRSCVVSSPRSRTVTCRCSLSRVRSPATAGRDAVLKRSGYARLGIRSYWLVDVDEPSIRVLRWRAGGYDDVAFAAGDEPLHVSEPFPVDLVPSQLVRV